MDIGNIRPSIYSNARFTHFRPRRAHNERVRSREPTLRISFVMQGRAVGSLSICKSGRRVTKSLLFFREWEEDYCVLAWMCSPMIDRRVKTFDSKRVDFEPPTRVTLMLLEGFTFVDRFLLLVVSSDYSSAIQLYLIVLYDILR